jgi:hypothetical protein
VGEEARVERVLIALLLLQIKHFAADYLLQSSRHVQCKGIYGHRAGLEHAAIHAVLTVPCLLLVGVSALSALAGAAVEFIIHYHEDWLKAQVNTRLKLTPEMRAYWVAYGADQLVHELTYLGLVAVLIVA